MEGGVCVCVMGVAVPVGIRSASTSVPACQALPLELRFRAVNETELLVQSFHTGVRERQNTMSRQVPTVPGDDMCCGESKTGQWGG